MRLFALALSALLFLAGPALGAPFVFNTSNSAIINIVSQPGSGTIPVGTAVVYNGNASASGFAAEVVIAPIAGRVDCVVHVNPSTEATSTRCLSSSESKALLLCGATWARGDKLKVIDSAGRFGPATNQDMSYVYTALEPCTSVGSLVWGRPGGLETTAQPVPAAGADGQTLVASGGQWTAAMPAVSGMSVLQAASFSLATDQSTTSGTLADITGASASMTTVAGSRVDVQCSFSTSTTTVLGANVNIVLGIDSMSDVGVTQTYPALSNAAQGGSISRLISGLSAGAHTFKLRWSTTSSARIRGASAPTAEHASCVVKELR